MCLLAPLLILKLQHVVQFNEGQRSRWRTQPVWSWSGDVIRDPLTRGQREECGAGVGAAGKACELGLFGKAT